MTRAKEIIKQVSERKGDDRSNIAAIAIENPTASEIADYCSEISSFMDAASTMINDDVNVAIISVLTNADTWQVTEDQAILEEGEDEEGEEERSEEEYDDEEEC